MAVHVSNVTNIPSKTTSKLLLERKWGYGALKTDEYKITKLGTFSTIGSMCWVLNLIFNDVEYSPEDNDFEELWFFEDGMVPKKDDVIRVKTSKSKIMELIVTDFNLDELDNILMYLFGETFPDGVVGIRIKPNRFGGQARIWILNQDAEIIKKFLEHRHYDFKYFIKSIN